MPNGVPIQISFNRAAANKALLQITKKDTNEKELKYEHQIIPLISPTLSCYFVESDKAKTFYSKTKLYDVSINFFDYNIRRELLLDNVAEHRVKLFEGRLPSSIVLGLIEPEVFEGSLDHSTFKFVPHDLDIMDLQIDNQSMDGYPLTMKSDNALCFYLEYLKATNRYENMFASGALSYNNFQDSNFLVFVNLKDQNQENGQVTLKLKFLNVLPKKLFLVFMPVYEKHITFDQYLNVSVGNVTT